MIRSLVTCAYNISHLYAYSLVGSIKVAAMQLLVMQHQEHWLCIVRQHLRRMDKDPDVIRTWLRLPYCISAHMDRVGCVFAYLSPDADPKTGKRVWLRFPLIRWGDGGVQRVACILMELEVCVCVCP